MWFQDAADAMFNLFNRTGRINRMNRTAVLHEPSFPWLQYKKVANIATIVGKVI